MPLLNQSLKTLKEFQEKAINLIDQRLNELLLAAMDSPFTLLFQSANYSLQSGGKRLRPLLTLAATEALGGHLEQALNPACALEMVHTYSLIHDDLPCMDNDDFRRGKPTLHRVYNEGHAVLTGDFLLTFAFDIIANAPQLSSDQKLNLISSLAKSAGAFGMIGGQVIDLSQKANSNLSELKLMHSAKTGALIKAALQFGGIIANASKQNLENLSSFGENIGLAFQIVDDVLDADEKTEKVTYVSLLGIEEAKCEAERLLKNALTSLHFIDADTNLLSELAKTLIYRNN